MQRIPQPTAPASNVDRDTRSGGREECGAAVVSPQHVATTPAQPARLVTPYILNPHAQCSPRHSECGMVTFETPMAARLSRGTIG